MNHHEPINPKVSPKGCIGNTTKTASGDWPYGSTLQTDRHWPAASVKPNACRPRVPRGPTCVCRSGRPVFPANTAPFDFETQKHTGQKQAISMFEHEYV